MLESKSMEIMIPNSCVKCGNCLTNEEKKIGLPLCQKCANSLIDAVKDKIHKSESKKYEDDVDNFSKFILSSGGLFKLEDIVMIQCSFNIFMNRTTGLANKNPDTAEKIFTDSIEFIEKELDNIYKDKCPSQSHMYNNRFVSAIDELIKNDDDNKKRR